MYSIYSTLSISKSQFFKRVQLMIGTWLPTWSFVPCNWNYEENDPHMVLWGVNAINRMSDYVGLGKKKFSFSVKCSIKLRVVHSLYRLLNQPRQEPNYTLISMPSVKSQSLTVPSIEQEYACSDDNKGVYSQEMHIFFLKKVWLMMQQIQKCITLSLFV